MLDYIGHCILISPPVMPPVVLIVLSLLYVASGDPAAMSAGDQATPENIERIRVTMDQGFWPYLQHLILSAATFLATLIGDSVITASVVAIPGIGRLTRDAILHRDYPVM